MKTDAVAEETWDLAPLFSDDDAFRAAQRTFTTDVLPEIEVFRGRMGLSAAIMAEALDALATASKTLRRLHCYASLRSDADTRVSEHRALKQSVDLLVTAFAESSAFVRPEILALDPVRLEQFTVSEPGLAPHAHFLRDLVRERDHVLSEPEERVIASSHLLSQAPSALYQILAHAELPRPELTLASGETIRLTPVAYQQHRSSPLREDRLRLFPAYFAPYGTFQATLGHNLFSGLKTHLFRARVRRYPSCLASSLASDNVPEGVYRNLIRQVRERLPVLHRYFELRARRLGLPQLEYVDLHCPITTAPPRRYTTREARELIAGCMEPLGAPYDRGLKQAFSQRWIDWHPADGKRSGAYATGWAYDVHPYVLLNFTGDHESVLTTAHELGHALHSHLSNARQPYPTADYSIFVAEVASTFNEILVLERMLYEARDPEERAFLLASHLESIRGTLFRQTMFAEFELDIHERLEAGEALTGERLSELYLALLRVYHGHDRGVVRVDDAYAVEWAAVPHFYYDFYVYQYATGIIAANALARSVLADEPGARERYVEFLSAGGSNYPLELLRRAGVDLESHAPYEAAFATILRHLDQLVSCFDACAAG